MHTIQHTTVVDPLCCGTSLHSATTIQFAQEVRLPLLANKSAHPIQQSCGCVKTMNLIGNMPHPVADIIVGPEWCYHEVVGRTSWEYLGNRLWQSSSKREKAIGRDLMKLK